MTRRVVIGVTGATGQIYAVRALELLESLEYEVHLILSDAAKVTIQQESGLELGDVTSLSSENYDHKNIGAPTASGSFKTAGMVIAPCSMKTLSNIAHGNTSNLISRSADVMLKERNPLVLMPREKPFNRIHLKNMLEVTDAGAIVSPPFPSYYQTDATMDEMVTRTMARALSYLDDIEVEYNEWGGLTDR